MHWLQELQIQVTRICLLADMVIDDFRKVNLEIFESLYN